MNVRYRVELSQAERGELTRMLGGGKHAARRLKRAQILLAADAGRSDEEIARSVAVGGSTVYRTKRRFVEGNLERALSEEQRPGAERKLTGKEEALLVAIACANPPEGRARWTLELLAGAMVKLTEHDEPVGRDGAPAAGREWSQALAQGHVVHSKDRWRIRRPHGRRARPLCRSARSRAAGGLLRRKPGPAHRRGAPADPGRAGPARTLRLRIPPQRHRQSLRRPRRAPALAQGQSHRAPHRRRLRPMHARTRRCPLSRRRAHPGRAGQPVDPFARRPLPGLPARRSQTLAAPPGVPLHPKARQLAQHGGDRDRRAARPVPGSAGSTMQRGSAAKSPLGSDSEMPPAARVKWMFSTDKARTKMGRTYPDTPKK